MILYTYGDIKPVIFRLVDSAGDVVTGHTFVAADMVHTGWNGSTWSTATNYGTECAEVSNGWYRWTPAAASRTQYEIIALHITDSAGATFVDNGVALYTGGNASAFHDG